MRKLPALLGAAALTLLLSGCYKMDADIKVNENETVDVSLGLAIEKDSYEMLEEMGTGSDEGIFDSFGSDEGVLKGGKTTEWNPDGYIGKKVVKNGISLKEYNADEDEGGLVHADGKYTLTLGTEDLATDDEMSIDDLPASMMPEIVMTFEFPGDVEKATKPGVVNGNKVTYTFDDKDSLKGMTDKIEIVAADKGASGGNAIAPILVGGLLVAGVAGAGVAYARRDRLDGPDSDE